MHIPQISAPFRPIHHIVSAGYGHHILQTAMELRLFDALEAGPLTIQELASALDTSPESTGALLEVLRALSLVTVSEGSYENSPSARQYLVQTSDACQAPFLSMLTNLYDSAMTDISFKMRHRGGEKEKTEKDWANPKVLEGMGRASLRGPVQNALAFVRNLPGFDAFTSMCDVGGNHGFYSMAFLDANPRLQATVCDLPHVTGPARQLHEKYGYAERMQVDNLNLETEAPTGFYDLVFTSHLLYNWNGRLSEVIGKLAGALKPKGWLVLNHMAPTQGAPDLINALVNFHTCLSGYPTHSLSQPALEAACHAVGLEEITTSLDPDTQNLLFAARMP